MHRTLLYISLFILSFATIQAQELNARLTINTQKIQVANKEIFTSLETSLNQLLNEQRWTDATFNRNERIDCTMSLVINEMPSEGSFKAELVVTSRRPVYNSSYLTTLLNFRDTQIDFNYTYGQSLDYNSMNITNNLVAVIAYYAHLIIGLDFNSFSPKGGKVYFDKAMEIANTAQSLGSRGWEPFSGKGNRYDIAVALTESTSDIYHSTWYNYHRLGLDEMAANAARGRIRITESVIELQKLREVRSSTPLFTLFSEAKVDEIVRVCSQSNVEEKKEIKKRLVSLFPTKSDIINTLK